MFSSSVEVYPESDVRTFPAFGKGSTGVPTLRPTDLSEWCTANSAPLNYIYKGVRDQSAILKPFTGQEPGRLDFQRPSVFFTRLPHPTIFHIKKAPTIYVESGCWFPNDFSWKPLKAGDAYVVKHPDVVTQCDTEGIFIGGKINFGHFVFENLLKLAIAARIPNGLEIPILVYDTLPQRHVDFISLCGFKRIIRVPGEEKSANKFSAAWFMSAPFRWSQSGQLQIWDEAVRWLNATARRTVKSSPSNRPRLLLPRSRTKHRRFVNDSQVSEVLNRHGVQPVFMEDLSAQEQINKVANAELIIAPGGAAMAVTVFAPPDCKILELEPAGFGSAFGSEAYSAILGQPYLKLDERVATPAELQDASITYPDIDAYQHYDYIVACERLESLLADTL